MSLSSFLFGKSKPKAVTTPTLLPGQERLIGGLTSQLQPVQSSGLQFLQSLIDQSPEALQAFQAPALRQFQEEILPGLSEQYNAAGALGGGNFRNAVLQQARQLSENLAAMRANLGLQAVGQSQGFYSPALSRAFETNFQAPRQGFLPGFLQGIAPIAGAALAPFTGGASLAIGSALGSLGGALGNRGGGMSGQVGRVGLY